MSSVVEMKMQSWIAHTVYVLTILISAVTMPMFCVKVYCVHLYTCCFFPSSLPWVSTLFSVFVPFSLFYPFFPFFPSPSQCLCIFKFCMLFYTYISQIGTVASRVRVLILCIIYSGALAVLVYSNSLRYTFSSKCWYSEIRTENGNCSTGDIRLIDGEGVDGENEGRLEVCINNAWGTVCEFLFDSLEVDVVCGQLGIGAGGQPVYLCVLYVYIHMELVIVIQ